MAALAAAALPAFAGEETVNDKDTHKQAVIEKPATETRFYMDLLAGGEFDIHATKFISNGTATFSPVTPLPATIQSRDFQSSHDAGVINGRLDFGYKVLPYLSLFTGFTYSHSGGNDSRRLGEVTDTTGAFGVAGGRYDLYAGVGQYQAYAGRAGIKLHTPRTVLDFLHIPKAIVPYASISAGGKYIDPQYVRFYSGGGAGVAPDAIVDTGRLKLYDESWVFTAEAELGYELQLTRNFSVILESGYGYDTKPERGSLGDNFTGVNDDGNRLYSTVSLGTKLSF